MSEQPPWQLPDVEDVEALLAEAFRDIHDPAVDMALVTAMARRRGRILRRRRQAATLVAACLTVVAVAGVGAQVGRLFHAVQQPARPPAPTASVASPTVPAHKVVLGSSVGFRSCPASPGNGDAMPPPKSAFVVVGLEGSPLPVNPCLSMQVDWARTRGMAVQFSAFAVPVTLEELRTTKPGGASSGPEQLVRAQTVGRERAHALVTTLVGRGLSSPTIWIEVMAQAHPAWPSGPQGQALNEALLRGLVAGIQEKGGSAGIATTAQSWATVTGNADLSTVPVWIGLSPQGYPDEEAACRTTSPTGGPVYLVAWSVSPTDGNVDLACPANPMLTP